MFFFYQKRRWNLFLEVVIEISYRFTIIYKIMKKRISKSCLIFFFNLIDNVLFLMTIGQWIMCCLQRKSDIRAILYYVSFNCCRIEIQWRNLSSSKQSVNGFQVWIKGKPYKRSHWPLVVGRVATPAYCRK